MQIDHDTPRFWLLVRVTISIAVALLIGSALATGWDRDGGRDWDYFQADLLSARQSILDNGELPFWMPHRSGGHDAFADPQSAWFSPFGLLVLIFDFPIGARLFLIGCGCFGALGAIQLGRELKLSSWACVLMLVILYLSMPMGLYAAGGIPNFSLGLAILPWLVLLVQRSTPWSTLVAGLLLAIALYSGDPNHFVWHSVFLALFGMALSVLRQSWKPFAMVLMSGASTVVFALPKMLPMWLLSKAQPRLVGIDGPGGNTLRLTYHAFLHPFPPYMERPQGEFVCLLQSGELVSYNFMDQRLVSQIVPGTICDWVNFGCYIGWLTVLLVVIGIVTLLLPIVRRGTSGQASRRQQKSTEESLGVSAISLVQRPVLSLILALAFASMIFYLLSLGTHLTPSLWVMLHHFPVFSSMKNPDRLLVYLLLPLSLLASIGLDGLIALARDRLDQQMIKTLAIVLISLVFLDVHLPSRNLYGVAFCEPPLMLPTTSPDCFQHEWDGREYTTTLYAAPVTPAVRAKKGLVNGYTIYNADTNVVPCSSDAHRSEVDSPDDQSAIAENIEFTARSIRFSYRADKPTEFVVNQNWYQGWEVVEPTTAEVLASADGRIAVKVPKSPTVAGQNVVRLKYTPPGLYRSLLCFGFALPIWLICVSVLHRRLSTSPATTSAASTSTTASTSTASTTA